MSEAIFRNVVNRVKGTRTKDARLGWDAAHEMLGERIEELEADRARLDFLLENRRFIDQHVITGSYVCLVACTGVVATSGSQFARDKREAIDKAMQPLPPCEEA